MKISIISLFPEMFGPILNTSILGRAKKKGLVEFEFVGGGAGMVLRADILAKALAKATEKNLQPSAYSLLPEEGRVVPTVVLTSASGTPYKQAKAKEFSKLDHLIIICGHYEGVDQRFIDQYVDEEISIGDYVLTGGELPAMIIADSVVRLIPGVLKKPEATLDESFTDSNLVEYPQYTRPDEFEGLRVPEILTSGNHGEVEKWRQKQALEKTKKTRPDLLKRV